MSEKGVAAIVKAVQKNSFWTGFLVLLSVPAWSLAPMNSATNSITRSADDGGGGISATATNSVTQSIAEDVILTTMASANNRIRSGWEQMAFYPGTVTSLTAASDVSVSSATLNWATPGSNGAVGTLPNASAYLIQVASTGFTSIFSNINTVSVTLSTSGRPLSESVGGGATSLDPNTTFYVQLWTRDNDANVSNVCP
jgi:hypothetical protein